jgi:cytochrome c556
MSVTVTALRGCLLLGSLAWMVACSPAPEGAGGATAEVDEESPAYQAYEYRHSLMTLVGNRFGIIRGMAQGEVPVDNARFTKAALDLAALSTMAREGFPEGSGDVPGTRALADIWTNAADFDNKMQDFEAAAGALADLAESGGFAAAQSGIDGLAQSCGGCHRPYRAEE